MAEKATERCNITRHGSTTQKVEPAQRKPWNPVECYQRFVNNNNNKEAQTKYTRTVTHQVDTDYLQKRIKAARPAAISIADSQNGGNNTG